MDSAIFYLLIEIAVLICACYAFITAFRSIWRGVVENAAWRLSRMWVAGWDRFRARHQQSRREAWWDTGFNHACETIVASEWTTREELLRNLQAFRNSRRG